jgi:DNA-cytosine methyltransferase
VLESIVITIIPKTMTKKTIKWGSDFSGVGAADYALKRLSEKKGFSIDTVYACDWDKYARITYQASHGTPPYYPKDVYEREIPKDSLDLYVTSPPCQAFSLAGKRLGKEDKRGILFFNSHEFIQENKPRFFIFENVKGLLSDDGGKTFQEWVNMLGGKSVNGVPILFPYEDSVPYHIYWKVINAKHHNVPQNRERVFIVGIRDDQDNSFSWPMEEPLTLRLKDVLETEVFEKYFLNEQQVENMQSSDFNQERERIQDGDTSGTLLSRDYKSPKCVRVKDNPEKYILSDKMVDHLKNADRANDITDSDKKDVANCITASYGKNNTDAEYFYVKSNLEKYYLSQKMIDGFVKHNENHSEKGTGFIFEPKDGEDVANCLRANPAINATDNTLKVGFINQDTQASSVYDENGVAQSMIAGTHGYAMGYIQVSDKNDEEPKIADYRADEGLRIRKDGISPCMTSSMQDYPEWNPKAGTRNPPLVIEKDTNKSDDEDPKIGAFRGRNPENPSDRTTGSPTEQRLEINSQGISNAITTVQKDNVLIQKDSNKKSKYNDKRLNETLDKNELLDGKPMIIDTYNKSIHEECPTLKKHHAENGDRKLWDGYKIRRLTPIECFRLMNFPDEIVHNARAQGMSDSQLYKQAGNSIVVRVLEKIFDKMPF